jgi:hypothetical protein
MRQNDMDDRKHLTSHEIEKLIAATKGSRNKIGVRLTYSVYNST